MTKHDKLDDKNDTAAPKQSAPKFFDVARPGKTPALSTSRPVIVGHKPQVRDPFVNKAAEQSTPGQAHPAPESPAGPVLQMTGPEDTHPVADGLLPPEPATQKHVRLPKGAIDELPRPTSTPQTPTVVVAQEDGANLTWLWWLLSGLFVLAGLGAAYLAVR